MSNEIELADIKAYTMVKIINLITNGMSKKDACAKYNTSTQTYDRYIKDHPSVVHEVLAIEREHIIDDYQRLHEAHGILVNKLIEAAQNPDLSNSEALVLESRIRTLITSTEQQLALIGQKESIDTPTAQSDAKSFLSHLDGPKFNKKPHKATFTRETFTLDLDDEIPATDDEEIIDSEVSEGED